MPVPKPQKGEKKDDFMARCMHEVSQNPDRENDQNVAICLDTWRKKDTQDAVMKKVFAFNDPEKKGLRWELSLTSAKGKKEDMEDEDKEDDFDDEEDDDEDTYDAVKNDDSEGGDDEGGDDSEMHASDKSDSAKDKKEAGELGNDDSANGGADPLGENVVANLSIYGDIGENSDSEASISAAAFRSALAEAGNISKLNIHINSAGGNMYDGISISNAISEHPAPSVAYVDGLAASAATIVALGADKTVMRDNSHYMIHNSWAAAVGDADLMTKAANHLKIADETISSMYARKTGLDKEVILKMMSNETWMTARQAKAKGFADSVKGTVGKAARASANNQFIFNSVALDLSHFKNIPAKLTRMRVKKSPPNKVSTPDVIISEFTMTSSADIKAKAPEAYNEIYALGAEEGIKRERERIAEIEAFDAPECKEIVAKAKADGSLASAIAVECFKAVNARKPQAVSPANARKLDAKDVNSLGADMSDVDKKEMSALEKRAAVADLIAGKNGNRK
jgi:ATP-dependent protease ClpP protease subunit